MKLIVVAFQIILVASAITGLIYYAKQERDRKRKLDPLQKSIDKISDAALAATLADLEAKTEEVKSRIAGLTIKETDLSNSAKVALKKAKADDKNILFG